MSHQLTELHNKYNPIEAYNYRKSIYKKITYQQAKEYKLFQEIYTIVKKEKREILVLLGQWLLNLKPQSSEIKFISEIINFDFEKWFLLKDKIKTLKEELSNAKSKKDEVEKQYYQKAPLGRVSEFFSNDKNLHDLYLTMKKAKKVLEEIEMSLSYAMYDQKILVKKFLKNCLNKIFEISLLDFSLAYEVHFAIQEMDQKVKNLWEKHVEIVNKNINEIKNDIFYLEKLYSSKSKV